MQPTGTLRKRRKRNLEKVNGLSTLKYIEDEDTFDGTIFSYVAQDKRDIELPYSSDERNESHTVVRMNSSKIAFSGRVTRDPRFHIDEYESELHVWRSHSIDGHLSSFSPAETDRQLNETIAKERSHFLNKTTIKRLRHLILLGATSGAFPWTWNEENYRIDKWTSTKEKLWWIQFYIAAINMIFLLFFNTYVFVRSFSDNETFRDAFMSSYSVTWYLCVIFYMVNTYFYMEETRGYINTLLRLNQEYVSNYLIHLDGYQDGGWGVLNISIPCGIFEVLMGVVMFFLMPNLPFYLVSYVYPQPWYWLILGGFHQYVVYGQTIAWYNLTWWIVLAHTNSVNFWLGESHNHNDSDFTTEDLRHPGTAFETFKTLQVLSTRFNECISPIALPFTKWICCTALIPCIYIMIRSMNHLFIDEFPSILLYPLEILNDGTAVLGALSLSAKMFDMSTSFIDSWRRTKQKGFRRLLMSCPCLKVRVRSFYFVTVATTITFFKVLFDIVTNCVIAFP